MKGGEDNWVVQSRSLLHSAEKAFVSLAIGFTNKGESLRLKLRPDRDSLPGKRELFG